MAVELTKADIIPQQTAGGGDGLQDIEKIIDKVMGWADKFKAFESKFGRPPANKQEAKYGNKVMDSGIPKQAGQPTNATAETNINKLQQENTQMKEKLKEIANMDIYVKLEEDKLNSLIDDMMKEADNMPDSYKNMTIKQALGFKNIMKSKVKKFMKEKIPEVVKIETGKSTNSNT